MDFSWTIFIDLGLISAALLLATYIRAKVRFFQKYLIPNALTAGFILLPIYNFIMPRLGLNSQGLENLVFHLLCISFIAMSLRGGESKGAGRRVFSSAVMVVAHYTLQAIIGFGLTMLFVYTLFPDLFPNFGFFLPLGFGLGPGQAFAIGKGWEAFGFEKAANLGLIFAAIGYVWGSFGCVLMVNIARRRGWMDTKRLDAIDRKRIRIGLFGPKEAKPVGSRLTTETEAIDTLSYNLAVILGVYLVAYLLLRLLTFLLSLLGPMGNQLATNFWGIAFVFAAVTALLAKSVLKRLNIDFTLDDGSLNRITGVSVDLMVAAAVGAIAIVVFTKYWIPIVAIIVVGGALTTLASIWLPSRIFREHRFDWARRLGRRV